MRLYFSPILLGNRVREIIVTLTCNKVLVWNWNNGGLLMKSTEKLRQLVSLVDFMADILGPNSEVVLHDTSDHAKSLLAIRNSSLSEREAGTGMSELALKILNEGKHTGKPFITNYLSKSFNSSKFIKASTYFIRDDEGEIIGMLGINTDLSALSEVHGLLGQMLDVREIDETVSTDDPITIRETVFAFIDQVIGAYGTDPVRMTTEEKKEVVEALNDRGVFLLKGVISEIAARLDVSEQTIYRYLK